jgi:hypothetical protein
LNEERDIENNFNLGAKSDGERFKYGCDWLSNSLIENFIGDRGVGEKFFFSFIFHKKLSR